ncbi:hypothetical protein H7B90_00830 [Cohnella xylanilytica]|uniref:Loader and inhibitor of G40P protein n=1 Tax=Cohnella xylanilytica TaxID=557555 RepID=A0A841TNN1_9BACL|nr:hypothetical protein [Cohnella xylanilytica]MBB6689936.1 hypothetical protein [Cohnella xylanilytica]
MELVEIAELYQHIKKYYPFFDASVERVKEDFKYLKDFPASVARDNIDRHILTETVTPGIAHIRGRLGEQIDRERMQSKTAEHVENLERWSQCDAPPPTGYWEEMKARLRGDRA